MRIEKLIDFENQKYNWAKIERVPEFATLKKCQQNPVWHSEGDSFIHTKLVCEKMLDILKEYHMTNEDFAPEIKILMTAALFHDIGKGVTTIFKKDNWHAYGHEIEGEKITRRLLWENGMEFRERVCSLVRWHMEPLHIFEGNGGKDYVTKLLRLSKRCNIKHVLLLKSADLRGSIQKDMVQKEQDFIKLIEIGRYARQLGCYNEPTWLPTEGNDFMWNWKTSKTAYVMIGLPGSGKDTFIEKQLFQGEAYHNKAFKIAKRDNTVILCRDDIRTELGFCKPGEKIVGTKYEEDKVTKVFKDRLLEASDAGKNIVINNINLKKAYRDDYHELLANHNYRFVYVYVEAEGGIDTNVSRRIDQIDYSVFESMVSRFEWPDFTEYDEFYKFTNKS